MRFRGSKSSIALLAWSGLTGLTLSGSTSCIDTGLLWLSSYEAKIILPVELTTPVSRPVGSAVDDLFYGEIHDLTGLPYTTFTGDIVARFYKDANCRTLMWDESDTFTTPATGSTFDFTIPGGPSRVESFYVRFFAVDSYTVGPSDCSAVLSFTAGPPSALYAWPLWAHDEDDIYSNTNYDRERFTAVANGIPTMVRARVGDTYGNQVDVSSYLFLASLAMVNPTVAPSGMTLGPVAYNSSSGYLEAMVTPPSIAGTYLIKMIVSGSLNFETAPFEFVVTPANASQLVLVPNEIFPTHQGGDSTFVRIVAQDMYGNIATNYTGKAQLKLGGTNVGGTHNFGAWERGATYQALPLPNLLASQSLIAYDPAGSVSSSSALTLALLAADSGCSTSNSNYLVNNSSLGWHEASNWSTTGVPNTSSFVTISNGMNLNIYSNADLNCFMGQSGSLLPSGVRLNVSGPSFRIQNGFGINGLLDLSMDDTSNLKFVELAPSAPLGKLYLNLSGNAVLRGQNGSDLANPAFTAQELELIGNGRLRVDAPIFRVTGSAVTVASGQEFIVGTYSHVHLNQGITVNGGGSLRILPGGHLTVGNGSQIKINAGGAFIARGSPNFTSRFGGVDDASRVSFRASTASAIELVYFEANFLDMDGIDLASTSTPAPAVSYGSVNNITPGGTGIQIGTKLLNRQLTNLQFSGFNNVTNYTPMRLNLNEYVFIREVWTNIDYRTNGDTLVDIMDGPGAAKLVPTFQDFYSGL